MVLLEMPGNGWSWDVLPPRSEFLSLPPRVCWGCCWFHGGHHKLDIRASEEMQGRHVPGMKDVRVTYAHPDGENEQPKSFHH